VKSIIIYFKQFFVVVVLGSPETSSGILGPVLFIFGSAAIIFLAAKMR